MRLLKIAEVVQRCALPRSTIYWKASLGEFPRPVKQGPRSSAWIESEVDGWLRARVEQSRGAAQ
jgi:prophage regulatory protein